MDDGLETEFLRRNSVSNQPTYGRSPSTCNPLTFFDSPAISSGDKKPRSLVTTTMLTIIMRLGLFVLPLVPQLFHVDTRADELQPHLCQGIIVDLCPIVRIESNTPGRERGRPEIIGGEYVVGLQIGHR